MGLLAAYCLLALMGSSRVAEAAATVPAEPNCPIPSAVTQVSAASMYANSSGSVVDQTGLHLNQQLIEPLRLFDRALTAKMDGSAIQADLACAETLLKTWAAADALLKEPTSFPPIRERQRFTIGINVGALKLQSHGGVIDDTVMAWLHQLNAAIMADFAKRNIVDNLYVWSAVDAASFALLSGDQAASQYQDRV
jgi:hypothetical protein